VDGYWYQHCCKDRSDISGIGVANQIRTKTTIPKYRGDTVGPGRARAEADRFATRTIDATGKHPSLFDRSADPHAPMRIVIIKRPPAPIMDGFVVSRFHENHIYDVDELMGSYLILAGYALSVESDDADPTASEASR
jgi:hypothetical protein